MKYIAAACILGMALIAGCGNNPTTANNADYSNVSPVTSATQPFGVALQKTTTLSLTGTVSILAGTAASFYHPVGITTDGSKLYIVDMDNHCIRMIDLATKQATIIAGKAGIAGFVDNATGTEALFRFPSDITIVGTFLYVTDTGNNAIRKIDTAGDHKVTLVAGSDSGAAGNSDSKTGPGTSASFNQPCGITADATYLYVADSYNNTIRAINLSTTAVTTIAGSPVNAGSADGTGSAARFNLPARLTTDGDDKYLFVTDVNNKTIRKIVIATGEVTTLAGVAGIQQSSLDTAPGIKATFMEPNGITADKDYLYVTDSYPTNKVRRIEKATGTVTTLAGTAALQGGSTAMSIAGITTDGSKLYLCSTNSSVIGVIE